MFPSCLLSRDNISLAKAKTISVVRTALVSIGMLVASVVLGIVSVQMLGQAAALALAPVVGSFAIAVFIVALMAMCAAIVLLLVVKSMVFSIVSPKVKPSIESGDKKP